MIDFAILGVQGQYTKDKRSDGLHAAQNWVSEERTSKNGNIRLKVYIRFDDECENEYETFAITCDGQSRFDKKSRWCGFGGCAHEEIVKLFPELKPLIVWHSWNMNGHNNSAVKSASYLASNRDHDGLLLGEKQQIRNGKTGVPCWEIEVSHEPRNKVEMENFEDLPELTVKWVPWCRTGEGKEREIDKAKRMLPGIDLSLQEWVLERKDLEILMNAQIPSIEANFKRVLEGMGFEMGERKQ